MQVYNLEKKKKYIKKIADYTADYYGFDFIEIDTKKHSGNEEEIPEKEKVHILKTILKNEGGKKITGTKLFFYNKPILNFSGKNNDKIILDIVNLDTAIAEALVLKTAIKILEDEGYSDIIIKLNSIGDKDSQKLFKKELTNYYKTVKDQLKAVEKKKISTDPFDIYYSKKEYLEEINAAAPTPIDNLSQVSLEHFKRVTEYIDNFGVEYVIDPQLVGEKRFFSKVIFKIFAKPEKGEVLEEVAFGGRYDELAATTLKKKKISAVGLHLSFKQKNKKNIKIRENKIDIHLLKIGSSAELKFFDIVDVFKKLHLPIKFSISERKISKQLELAKKQNADKLIILGEREAKNNKVVVRDVDDFSQNELRVADLEKYLKKLI